MYVVFDANVPTPIPHGLVPELIAHCTLLQECHFAHKSCTRVSLPPNTEQAPLQYHGYKPYTMSKYIMHGGTWPVYYDYHALYANLIIGIIGISD